MTRWLLNVRILLNHTIKNFQVKHGQCDSIIFPETLFVASSKYLLDLLLGDIRILLRGPRIYTLIYHNSTSCSTYL